MRNKLNIFILLTVVAMFLVACDYYKPKHTATTGISKVICEESFQNILEQEIEVFEYQYPEANVLPRYMSENAAFDSLFSGKVDLIVVSHDLATNEKEYLKSSSRAYRSRMIAVDAVAIIVNKDNDIDELSLTELKDIFTGKFECRIWLIVPYLIFISFFWSFVSFQPLSWLPRPYVPLRAASPLL